MVGGSRFRNILLARIKWGRRKFHLIEEVTHTIARRKSVDAAVDQLVSQDDPAVVGIGN